MQRPDARNHETPFGLGSWSHQWSRERSLRLVLVRTMEFREKDLWTFLEDSSRESKSCSSSKIEKIQRPGGQQTLLRWGTAS
jgi:hypothetical protein